MTLAVAFCCWETWFSSITATQSCCWFVAADGESWLARKTRLGKDACRCLLLLGTLVSQENFCRLLLMGNPGWPGKQGWGKTLVVACCCWEPWLARKTSADYCCWLVAVVGNPGWPGKTRLGKDACRCLLLLGTLVSQENFCRLLLLVGSCCWGILVGQEKLDWGITLVLACCCWELCLARKISADCCCWLVDAGREAWLARKTRLGTDACRCLLLLRNLVSQAKLLQKAVAVW